MSACSVLEVSALLRQSNTSVISSDSRELSPLSIKQDSTASLTSSTSPFLLLSSGTHDEEQQQETWKERSNTTVRVFMTSVYNSVFEKISERLSARCKLGGVNLVIERDPKKVASCDVIIGDRHSAKSMSCALRAAPPRSAGQDAPLLNFFESAEKLTLKVSMARLLQDNAVTAAFSPITFVLVPQQQQQQNQDDSTTIIEAQQQKQEMSATVPLAESAQNSTNAGAGAGKRRASALPTKAMRMAMAAAKTGVAVNADDRAALAAAMKANPTATWIAKPTAGKGGVGCFLSRDLNELLNHVETFNPATAPSHSVRYGKSSPSSAQHTAKDDDDDDDEEQPQQQSAAASTAPAGATKKSSRSKFVVQEYIEKPLLVYDRKFDIRVWTALSSSAAGEFVVHVFSEGSCRLASAPYKGVENLENPFEHITNHDLQKHAATGYGDLCPGNEMWYGRLAPILQERYERRVEELRARHGALLSEIAKYTLKSAAVNDDGDEKKNSAIFEEFVRPQLHHIIIQSFLAARSFLQVSPGFGHKVHQLFGFDMIVDEELNVKLLEINGAPGTAQCLLQPFVDGAIDHLIAPHSTVLKTMLAPWELLSQDSRMGTWSQIFSAV